MSSNLFNKALKNIKTKDNLNKINCSEDEINENLKKSFEFELKNITKTIQLQKLLPNKLYEFLIKYENNLPQEFFYKHTMELGDVLLRHGYSLIARNQCYERYLVNVHNLDVFHIELDDLDSHLSLEQIHQTESIVSAIFGLCLAEFRCMEILDKRFQANFHQRKCHCLLTIYRRLMEIILKQERFCWLIYNGSVCIYWISEALIRSGLSMMVVEPLVWASCCLETSIPLLTIFNLKWRAVIYTATCQALFNIQYDSDAEAFARRALVKINELHELYEISSDARSTENAIIFSEAVIKMGVMIFKRNAFETRRRPKTYLRPKTKVNFKEILQNNWPRTGTERILAEMFDSPSQQILAIMEAVKQPSRTIGKIEAPASENEWEMLDVYSELFYAAIAIITGRSTSVIGKSDKALVKEYRIVDVDENTDQLALSVLNGSAITIKATFELVCWAFSYGNWEFLDTILDPLLAAIKDSKSLSHKLPLENTLKLIRLMRKCFHSSVFVEKKVVKLSEQPIEDDRKQGDTQMNFRAPQRSNSSVSKDTRSSKSRKDNPPADEEEKKGKQSQDPLCQLSELLKEIIATDFNPGNYFQEILVEAGLILWNKCKPIFQTTQDGSLSNEPSKPIPSIGKWIRILDTAYRILSVTEYSTINPISYSEISIRLSVLLEQLSINNWFSTNTSEDDNCQELSLESFISQLKTEGTSKSMKCIAAAKKIMRTSLSQLNKARNLQNLDKASNQDDKVKLIGNNLDDLYLELNSIHLRTCAREIVIHLFIIGEEIKKMNEIRQSKFYQEAIQFCNKNLLFLAILQAHLGNLLRNNLCLEDRIELVNHIKSLIEKSENNLSDVKLNQKPNSDKMPAPIIERKGSNYIIVKVDENVPSELKSKIGWIRLYGRAVDSPNAEVRLTDDKLPGTGVETSCLSTKFTIYDLTVNEQYILAFSINDKFGSPIGRGIGKSTKYILAIDTINPVTAISIITQILYEMGQKEEVIWYENLLWPQFVEAIPDCVETYQRSVLPRSSFHKEYKIKVDVLNNSSPMLLRKFCVSVLSAIDCECRILNITNDINVKSHSQMGDQINRLKMVDKLLALFSISKKLKDSLLTMEIFTTVACLLAPIMNQNQFFKPYFSVLSTCVNVLVGLPQTTWIKIPAALKTYIHHLSACIGFYLLKCLNNFPSYGDFSETIRQSVTLLLQMSGNAPFTVTEQEDTSGTASQIEIKSEKSQINPQKKVIVKVNKGENSAANFSVQQVAFESFKFTLAKQGLVDHQLSGNEEPDILMAYITLLPSRHAYKEVLKFSRKNRYLQFIVEILHKAVVEGNLENSLNYYREIKEWLKKRNEAILGRSLIQLQSQMNRETIQTKSQNPAVISDNNLFSRSVRTDEDVEDSKRPSKPKKKAKYKLQSDKAINVLPSMSETQKQIQEQAELKALDVLSTTFVSMYKQNLRRRRFRQLSEYERVSRIKMNCSMAMGYLAISHAKVDSLTQILNGGFRFSEVPEIEDITKFMLESTGKILPLDETPIPDQISTVLKMTKQQTSRQTDTPRTYRSDVNVSEKRLFVEAPKLLSQLSDAMNKAALLLKRAIVLAARSKVWVLLFKACSLSWYTLSSFINTTNRLTKFLNAAKKDFPEVDWSQIQSFSMNNLFKLYSSVFFFGSQSILDMIEVLGKSNLHKISKDFDENFTENFILKSVHLLFETGSYEKSIHVILRFTSITNYLFVNVTHPILIESQQQLCQKAKDNQARNPDWTLQQCEQYVTDCQSKMKVDHLDSSNYQQFLNKILSGYFGRKKLYQSKSKVLRKVQQSEHEDLYVNNLLNILKSEASSNLIFSVPVRPEVSHKEWVTYQNVRSIKREWMELYYKRNYFDYLHSSDCITVGNNHKMNLQELLTSYKEFLDNSLSNNDLNHYSFALNAMGDLYISHLHKPSLALSAWNGSLDCLLNQKQSVKNISQIIGIIDKDFVKCQFQMEKLLSKFGGIKCLVIGGLLTKVSRLDDLTCDERLNICLNAAMFYKAIYSGSFAHPEDDMNYLVHSLYLDAANSIPLVPKVNIFSNSSVISVEDVESQLYFLITHLVKAGYYQFSICLLSLYEHIVYTISRSSVKSIEAQMIKLEICIRLRRFSTASRLLFQLFTGDKVPQLADSRPAATVTKTPANVYDDQKQLTDEKNLIVLDKIISRRIVPSLAQRLGPTIASKISLLQALFLIELSSCVPVSPEMLDPSRYSSPLQAPVLSKKPTTKKSEPIGIQTEEESHSILDSLASNLQYSTWKDISLPILKGLMLHAATAIVHPIIEDFILAIQREDFMHLKLNLYEVDNVFFGLLVQARNCRLRLRNRSGARLAMFAGRLLKEYFDESISFDTKSARVFEHLDIFSHMKWNQELVECLLGEVSVENPLDVSETAISDVPPVKDVIISCIGECDGKGLLQHKAWFISALAQYSFISGYEVEKYKAILSESVEIFDNINWLSDHSENAFIVSQLRGINQLISSTDKPDLRRSIVDAEKALRKLHERLLNTIDGKYLQSVMWNVNEPDLSSVQIANVYDGKLNYLCKIKLLFGIIFMEKSRFATEKQELRMKALAVLNVGLDICRSLSRRVPWIETEYFLTIGRIQRLLISSGKVSHLSTINTFLEGLRLCVLSTGHLGLKKQFFLELAITFMISSHLVGDSVEKDGEIVESTKLLFNTHQAQMLQNHKISKNEALTFKRLSWLAIKCASSVSDSIQHLNYCKSDTSKLLSEDAQDNFPISALFDLYGRFKLGSKRITFKNEIEEELSRMPEYKLLKDNENLDDQLDKIKPYTSRTSLSQVLAYHEVLMKLTNNTFLTKSESFELRVKPLTRCIFNDDQFFEKEEEINKFLFQHIPEYRGKCITLIPKDFSNLSPTNTSEGIEELIIGNVNEEIWNTRIVEGESIETPQCLRLFTEYPKGILLSIEIPERIPLEKSEVNETEIFMNFYESPFEFHMESESRTMMLYAESKKVPKSVNKSESILSGWLLISSKDIFPVYQDFRESAQLLEILANNPESTTASKSSEGVKKPPSNASSGNPNNTKQLKASSQILPLPVGSEISVIELNVRQGLDRLASWVRQTSSILFTPPYDGLIKNSEHMYTVVTSGCIVNAIPFDVTKENLRLLSNALNPILSRPIINAPQLSKFVQDVLKIDF